MNLPPNSETSQWKAVIAFSESAGKEGTTIYSWDNTSYPQLGLDKLKRFVKKCDENGDLKVAVFYDNKTGVEIDRMYAGRII